MQRTGPFHEPYQALMVILKVTIRSVGPLVIGHQFAHTKYRASGLFHNAFVLARYDTSRLNVQDTRIPLC